MVLLLLLLCTADLPHSLHTGIGAGIATTELMPVIHKGPDSLVGSRTGRVGEVGGLPGGGGGGGKEVVVRAGGAAVGSGRT